MEKNGKNGKRRYVIDTVGLVSFFCEVFDSRPDVGLVSISRRARNVIQEALLPLDYSRVLLSVPSIVFVEIYEKWIRSEKFLREFFYRVFKPIQQSPNVEIRAIDQEVLGNLVHVDGCLAEHDLHDKIVVASAMTLECPIITVDLKIIRFVQERPGKISGVLN